MVSEKIDLSIDNGNFTHDELKEIREVNGLNEEISKWKKI
jgi:hypothetical protein